MLRMVSYPHRPQSGHIMCYLNRTYHVLPTRVLRYIDDLELCPYPVACTRKILKYPISGLPTTLPIWSVELLCCG